MILFPNILHAVLPVCWQMSRPLTIIAVIVGVVGGIWLGIEMDRALKIFWQGDAP